jgi:hypothetical protein
MWRMHACSGACCLPQQRCGAGLVSRIRILVQPPPPRPSPPYPGTAQVEQHNAETPAAPSDLAALCVRRRGGIEGWCGVKVRRRLLLWVEAGVAKASRRDGGMGGGAYTCKWA